MRPAGVVAYVGLGGNLGQPARQLACALHRLGAWPGVTALRSSRLYRTPPWGGREQPDYVNAVAEIVYAGTATALMHGLLAIERESGRVREGDRWGPRTLDLDLLLFGDQVSATPDLTVPHPRLAERAFVLVPLAELVPDLVIAGYGPVADLLQRLTASDQAILPLPH